MQVISRQRGVSLIEVLVAVLIFSLGLIGMAGLMMLATRSNQSAYLRTQVAFLANGIADRMRANPIAVWDGSYNSKALPTSTTQDCTSSGCTPDQLAAHDLGEWSGQLKTFLATPAATINCDTSKSCTFMQWNAELVVCGKQFRINFINTLRCIGVDLGG